MQSYIDLAEKFHKEAYERSLLDSGVTNAYVNRALEVISKNIALEYIDDLAKIWPLIVNPEKADFDPNYRKAAREFLKFLKNFKNGPLYFSLSKDEKTYFVEYEDLIDAEIDDQDLLQKLLPQYMVSIEAIIKRRA